jgi:hypothetical protein
VLCYPSDRFIAPVFVGIADQNGVAVGSCEVLDRFDNRGKKWVPNIENDDANWSVYYGREQVA